MREPPPPGTLVELRRRDRRPEPAYVVDVRAERFDVDGRPLPYRAERGERRVGESIIPAMPATAIRLIAAQIAVQVSFDGSQVDGLQVPNAGDRSVAHTLERFDRREHEAAA